MKNFIAKALLYIKNKGFLKILINGRYYLILQHKKRKLSYKYLKGEGIEIGALMNPLPYNKKTTKVKYCDYKSKEDLIKEYPDLKNFNIVETTYICGADNLECIKDNSQNFVIASHVFEHLTNPIKALQEFYRVIKNDGIIYLVVPEKTRTGDKFRSITQLSHIIDDYLKPSQKRDLEHFEEFVLKYKNKEEREKKAMELQKKIESFHYHVFTEETTIEIIDRCKKELLIGFEIIDHKPLYKNNPADLDFILIIKCHKND